MRLHLKIVGALAVALSISPSFAAEKPKGYTYLALGDSIPYGFDPTRLKPGIPPNPHKFTGYPEIVAKFGGLEHVNAACPGETSGSFMSNVMDLGCNNKSPQGLPGFKTSGSLHTNYVGNQLDFAVAQLRANPGINLITLSIGGNDLSLLQYYCATVPLPYTTFGECVDNEIPTVLSIYGHNLERILQTLRGIPPYRYNGRIVLMTNYSPSADPLFKNAVSALNLVMRQVAANPALGVTIADGFTTFQVASTELGGGDPCTAGLLVSLSKAKPPTACDIHPSDFGQNLLAATVSIDSKKKKYDDDKDDDD